MTFICGLNGASLAAPVVPGPNPPAPSQVTPHSLAPSENPPALQSDIAKPAPAPPPSQADKLVLRVNQIKVEGGFAPLDEMAVQLARTLTHQKVSVAQLYAYAAALEQAYARAGFVLVRVVVPPQRLVDGGDVRVKVIDGFIERVELKGVAPAARALVERRALSLVGKPRVTEAQIERVVLNAGDLPGVTLKSALARGEKEGGSLLVLEGEQKLVSASIGGDNKLPTTLGRSESNLSLSLNNAFGFGEQGYVNIVSGLALKEYGFPISPLRSFGGGVIAPLGNDGFTINPEFTKSRTRPIPAKNSPPSEGVFQRLAVRGSYPLIRAHDETLSLTAGVERLSQILLSRQFGTLINQDAYSALRLGANWRRDTPWGQPFSLNLSFSQGLTGRNGKTGAPISHAGASPQFSVVSGEFKLTQTLPNGNLLNLFSRGQISLSKPLFTSEQFALDGPEGLSAAPSGTFSLDTGATLREEFSHPFDLPSDNMPLTLSPYVFGAQGAGQMFEAERGQQAQQWGLAYGLGSRFNWSRGAASGQFAAEMGRLFSNVPNQRAATRLNLSLSAHF